MKLNKRNIFVSEKEQFSKCEALKKLNMLILSMPCEYIELPEKFLRDKFLSIIVSPFCESIEFLINVLRDNGTYYINVNIEFHHGTSELCFGDKYLRLNSLEKERIEEVNLIEEEILEFEELYLPEVNTFLDMILNLKEEDIPQIILSDLKSN